MQKNRFLILCFVFNPILTFGQLKEVLSLDDCVQTALARSNDVKRSALEIQKSHVYIQQAEASVYPNFNLTFSPSLNLGRSIDPYTNQYVDRNIFSSSIGAGSSINIFNGFQQKNAVIQTTINGKITEWSARSVKNKLVSDIYQAYLRVLLVKEYIKIGEKQLEILDEQTSVVKTQISVGVLTDLDLLNIQTQLNLDELNLLTNKNNLHIALINLKQLLNLPNFSQIDIQSIDYEKTKKIEFLENKQDILTRVTGTNPSFKIATFRARIAENNIEQIKYLKYPSIGFSFGINSTYSSAAPKEVFISDGGQPFTIFQQSDKYVKIGGKNENLWEPIKIPSGSYKSFSFIQQLLLNKYFFFGLTIKVPIYNGNQLNQKESLAEIDKKMQEIELKNLSMQLQYNAEQMLESINLLKKKRPILLQKLKAINASFIVVSEKFKLGYATSNDFIMAKNSLEKVESELVQNQLEIFFNEKMLDLLMYPM